MKVNEISVLWGKIMWRNTEEYKGRQFECDYCGYVVSSNAMSDFDVDDFEYCPCCGKEIDY